MNDDLSIWRSMCRIHHFDEQCHNAIESGRVKTFTYLSSGQEAIAPAVAAAFSDRKVNIFCQHRCHDAYIAFGGDVKKLRDELLGLESGTTGGIGGDPMHHFTRDDSVPAEFRVPRPWMVGHSGLVADQVPIAVGMAYATEEWSLCFIGDSTVEEDVFWPAVGFAVTHKLPVLFVEEDNNLSVITTTSKRRHWASAAVADAYGSNPVTCVDEPFHLAERLKYPPRPYYLRITTCRKYRHVGSGTDGPMARDRMAMVRQEMFQKHKDNAREIEAKAIREMSLLWNGTV